MKVLVAGDFCPQHRVAELFEKGSFSRVLGDVKETIESADYSIVNFECPITKGGEKLIEKIGPNLQCGESGMKAVKWAGFDCITLANNHFLDYGEEGVKNTLETCKKYDIDTVGGGVNLHEASRILYKEIKGQTLAIINCCEHEFSIATEDTAGSNPLNPIQQYYAIQEAKKNADYVLVIVHGGHEMWQLPSPRMQETYRFFVDAGADAVVNHHQHCYSGFEKYKGGMIFYGLGNFLFENILNSNDNWNKGFFIELNLNKKFQHESRVYPYTQCEQSPTIHVINEHELLSFNEKLKCLNSIILDLEKLNKEYNEWIKKGNTEYELLLQPFSNRIIKGLYRRKILPSMLSKKRLLKILNCIECESHKERMTFAVKYLTYNE